MRLLLIEDEPDLRFILRLTLERSGFEVVEARGGEEGLRLASGGGYDAILLDVMMPGIDGYSVCRALKADPRTSGTPVVFLTAKVQENEIGEGLAAGAVGYLAKPFDVATLSTELTALLR